MLHISKCSDFKFTFHLWCASLKADPFLYANICSTYIKHLSDFTLALVRMRHSHFSQVCARLLQQPPLPLGSMRHLHWILPELLLLGWPQSKNMSLFYFWSSLRFVVQGGRSAVKPQEDVTEMGTPRSNRLGYCLRKDTNPAWSSRPKSGLSRFDLWTLTENTN